MRSRTSTVLIQFGFCTFNGYPESQLESAIARAAFISLRPTTAYVRQYDSFSGTTDGTGFQLNPAVQCASNSRQPSSRAMNPS